MIRPLAERPDWDIGIDDDDTPLPVCDFCGRRISDPYYYEVMGDVICEDCMNEEYRRDTDDYVEAHEGPPED